MTAPSNAKRLSDATLAAVRPGVRIPAYDRASVRPGVLHFGPGAFHRAHQVSYFDQLLTRDPRWGVRGVSLKSPGVRDALAPQDGLYVLAELDAVTRFRIIGALKSVLVAAEAPDAVFAAMISRDTRLVTMTVTEKGYCLDTAGELDLANGDIRHDLTRPGPPASLIGWLVEGLARRRAAGFAPFVMLSCDNLPDNGDRLGRAVVRFARARGDTGLAAWIEAEARFPKSMVDSITPATDAALKARVVREAGLVDAWPVQRERFVQWVVQDNLGPDAPDLAAVGVTLTNDVAGFERAKLRLLNGAHSSLAYLGGLAGHDTVAEAMADAALAGFVRTLMRQDIAPSLRAPQGMSIDAYVESILARFRNPEIRHNLSQIAWDGSQKLPIRLLATTQDALAAGRPVRRLAAPVAAWMRFVVEAAGDRARLVDPLADRLRQAAAGCAGSASTDVDAFLALEPIFPPALAAAPRFRAAVEAAYDDLLQGGVARLLARLSAEG